MKLSCFNSAYYLEKGLYGVICESPNIGDSRGDIYMYLVKRVPTGESKVEGKELSMLRYQKSGNINFNEKKTIKLVKFDKGTTFASDYQFMVYDEPFIHQGHQTTSKDNLFFLIASVTGEGDNMRFDQDLRGSDPKSKSCIARLIDLTEVRKGSSTVGGPIAEFNDMYRIVNLDSIDKILVITGHFNNINNMLSAIKCQVNTKNGNFVIEKCVKLTSKFESDLAFQQFFQSDKNEAIKRVATYSHRTKQIRVCNLIITDLKIDQSSYEDGCATIKARSTFVKDIAFGIFD